MNVINGDLPGTLIIEPKVFGDARGWFLETWNAARYRAAGLSLDFVQDNVSFSRHGILRGLHFQNPNPQGKLVMALQGEVLDVVVDLRRSSPTFKRWQAVRLTGESKRQFYVPPGLAHGFVVLSDEAVFQYKCTALYSPADEQTLRWDDPELGIDWGIGDPILSAKDAGARRLSEIPPDKLYP